MRKLTFTIYNEDDTIHSYLFEVTQEEAQEEHEREKTEKIG